jgi:hypothetical protein
MTREEKRKEKERIEKEFIDSLKNKNITSEQKAKFRTTSFWKNFRNALKAKMKFDFLTGRKLTKTWNCHHRRTDSKLYTVLDEKNFMCLNNQMHDWWHITYEEMRKNPKFLDRVKIEVLKDLNENNWESFIYKKLENQTIEKKRKKK